MCYEATSSNLYPENESTSITRETFQEKVKGMHTVILTVPMLYSLQPALWLAISSLPSMCRSTIKFTIHQSSSSKIHQYHGLIQLLTNKTTFYLSACRQFGLSFVDPQRQFLSNNDKNKQGSISSTQGKDTTWKWMNFYSNWHNNKSCMFFGYWWHNNFSG